MGCSQYSHSHSATSVQCDGQMVEGRLLRELQMVVGGWLLSRLIISPGYRMKKKVVGASVCSYGWGYQMGDGWCPHQPPAWELMVVRRPVFKDCPLLGNVIRMWCVDNYLVFLWFHLVTVWHTAPLFMGVLPGEVIILGVVRWLHDLPGYIVRTRVQHEGAIVVELLC